MHEAVDNLAVAGMGRNSAAPHRPLVTDTDGLDAFPAEALEPRPTTQAQTPDGSCDELDPLSCFAAESLLEEVPAAPVIAAPAIAAPAVKRADWNAAAARRTTPRVRPQVQVFLSATLAALVVGTTGFGTFALLRRFPAAVPQPLIGARPELPPSNAGYAVARNEGVNFSTAPPVARSESGQEGRDQPDTKASLPGDSPRVSVEPLKRERSQPAAARAMTTTGSRGRSVDPSPMRVSPTVPPIDRAVAPLEQSDQSIGITAPYVSSSLPTPTVPDPPSSFRSSSVAIPAAPRDMTPPTAEVADEDAIKSVLNGYRRAFSALDAGAAKTIWPTVDAKALGKSFDQLAQQRFEFDACRIDVASVSAVASCSGRAEYVPKIGTRSARVEPRQWTFSLRKLNRAWVIDGVASR